MSETTGGTDRAGRRAKRFLTPSHKYEIWLQLVRQEVTIAEAAAEHQVDRTTIMRIRTVDGKTVTKLLTAEQLDRYRPWLDNASRLRRLVHELETLTVRAVENAEGWGS